MIIFRYLFRELYTHLLMITLMLLIVFIINQFVHFEQELVNGQLTIMGLMKIMVLQIPLLLGYLLPMSLYLAILIVFGRLYMDHEMVVLNACGVSKAKLFGIVMIFGTLVFVFVTWLMIWLEPIAENYQYNALNEAIMSGLVERIVPKQFVGLNKVGMVYVENVSRKNKEMIQPFFAVDKAEKNQALPTWDITLAQSVKDKSMDNGEEYLVFNHGIRYVGVPGQLNFKEMSFNQYGVKLSFLTSLRHNYIEIPTSILWGMRKHDLKAQSILQWRIAFPVSTLILVLLAIPLTEVNPRLGKYARLLPAILIYTVYADLLFLARSWIKNGTISPELGMWWIHIAMILFAILMILRVTVRRWIRGWFKPVLSKG